MKPFLNCPFSLLRILEHFGEPVIRIVLVCFERLLHLVDAPLDLCLDDRIHHADRMIGWNPVVDTRG